LLFILRWSSNEDFQFSPLLLTVIIVNYNVKYFLDYCLYSVTKSIEKLEGEVIVVDNNSTDGSRAFFENRYHHVRFIWNAENAGFAKANNQALEMATGKYILFLNPDTIVPEDCFKKCIEFIESKNNAIACGVKMVTGSGRFLKESKRSFPSPITSFFKISGLSMLFPKSKTFSRYHLGYLDENLNHEIDVIAGAFAMIPKKILDLVGGFDERFFMYGEDIDLSYRIQKAGFKNFYFAETCIIHFKGESTKKGSLNYVRLFYSAMSIFVKKHYREMKAGIFNFLIRVAIFFRAILAALARFLKWIGLPAIDAATVLISFWIIKFFWNRYVKQEVNYSDNLLLIAFPSFTIIFLLASFFSGLYDNGYKQSRLNKSTATAIITLLAIYSLLPESLRFSRGILFFGSLAAFFFMSVTRRFLLHWHIIDRAIPGEGISQVIIAGSEKDLHEVSSILRNTVVKEHLLGRISPGNMHEPNTIGTLEDFNKVAKRYPIREIILCEGILSFKEIIDFMIENPIHLRIKIFRPGTHFLIGSGVIVETPNPDNSPIRLGQTLYRRNKSLSDLIISLIFIMTFPLHLFLQKRPFKFFKNVLDVIFLHKTWVGYATSEKVLPPLRDGILTTTGLPGVLNTLNKENLKDADIQYARFFNIGTDFRLVWLNYKLLS
jgi:GT2 family glycosyltransferase